MPMYDHAPAEALQRATLQRAEGAVPEGLEDDEHPLQTLQRQAGNTAVAAAVQRDELSPVLDVVGRGGGRPLDDTTRTDMEARIGSDFTDVRIHDDPAAQRSATAVGARAYTSGHEVVLGEGLSLGSPEGQHTLAHELTHVVQQRQGPVDGTSTGDGVSISDPSDRFEQEAEANATKVMSGEPSAVGGGAGGASVQNQSLQREGLPGEEEEVQATALQREELADDDENTPSLA